MDDPVTPAAPPHAYLMDMDGVLVRGAQLIPGADNFIERLRAQGIPFLVLTNNSLYTPRDLQLRLERIGLRVHEEETVHLGAGDRAVPSRSTAPWDGLLDRWEYAGTALSACGDGPRATSPAVTCLDFPSTKYTRILDLHDTVLIGFEMGTGEVVCYLATHGSERVSRAILLAPLQPFLLQTPDNRDGIPGRVFDSMMQAIAADRPVYISKFLNDSYNVNLLSGSRVSDDAIHLSWTIAVRASATGTLESVRSWLTDFHHDLPRLDMPVLVVQGDQDRILPHRYTGKCLPGLIREAQFVVIEGGPHVVTWTHAEEVNLALLDFLT